MAATMTAADAKHIGLASVQTGALVEAQKQIATLLADGSPFDRESFVQYITASFEWADLVEVKRRMNLMDDYNLFHLYAYLHALHVLPRERKYMAARQLFADRWCQVGRVSGLQDLKFCFREENTDAKATKTRGPR